MNIKFEEKEENFTNNFYKNSNRDAFDVMWKNEAQN